MSLTRDNPPGCNVTTPLDYEYLINGAVSIGYTDGELWDQTSINQGLGAATFSIQDKTSETQKFSIRLEDHPDINDIGLNFCYESSALGTLKAYTYKDKSIMSSLQILEEFGSNEENSSHILYEYVTQIQSILRLLVGTTTLAPSFSKDDAKEAVFSNLNKLVGIISFDDNYDLVEDNFQLNGDTSFPASNTIRLKLNLSSIIPSLDEPFTIVLNFNDYTNANSLFTLNIENIKINDQYGNFSISLIDGYDESSKSIIGDNLKIDNLTNLIGNINSDPYVDLQDLPILVQFGISTTKTMKYHITGIFELDTLLDMGALILGQDLLSRSYEVEVFVQIMDDINLNNLHSVICSIKINDLINNDKPSILTVSSYKATSSDILIYKDDIYIKRRVDYMTRKGFSWACSSVEYKYLKTTSTYFTGDILSWFVLYLLNNQYIYDTIQSNMTSSSTKPLDLITSFQNQKDNNQFYLDLNIPVLGGDLYLKYGDLSEGYVLKSLSLSMGLLSIVNINLNVTLDHEIGDAQFQSGIDTILNKIEVFKNSSETMNLNYASSINDSNNIKTYTTSDQSDKTWLNYNGYSW